MKRIQLKDSSDISFLSREEMRSVVGGTECILKCPGKPEAKYTGCLTCGGGSGHVICYNDSGNLEARCESSGTSGTSGSSGTSGT